MMDRSVLITGGTGSFGRAFAEHLLRNTQVDRLCIYSRSEHAQAEMRASLGDDQRLRFFIGDVRDQARLRRAMDGVDLVVHAAALKRIEVCMYNPDEIIKTNVIGAMNVLDAARDAGVSKVVALSTDKAWQPVSAYGQSKAIAEQIMLASNNTRGRRGPLVSVTRYGNVWKSAGSVVPTWQAMIDRGIYRVPVTDPDCTRFFMTMAEACDLVLATAHAMPSQVVIPTLPAYRLGDLVDAMGVDMDVKGLPWYEKKHEGMRDGLTSDQARRMTVEELRSAL